MEDILELSAEEQRALVQRLCHKQVYAMLDAMDRAHYRLRNPPEDARERPLRAAEKSALDHHLDQLRQMVFDSIGFTPELKPSTIEHEAAGDGVFVNGE